VIATNKCEPLSTTVLARAPDPVVSLPKPPRREYRGLALGWSTSRISEPRQDDTEAVTQVNIPPAIAPATEPQAIDPLYLLACHVEWEQQENPSAAWELLAAARSAHSDTRAQARELLAGSRSLSGMGLALSSPCSARQKRSSAMETHMNAPYGLDIVENCVECNHAKPLFYCGFSQPMLHSLSQASHRSTLPAGAILFVEGQAPRGMFILCSGTVNLSTTSHIGKTLMLRSAEAGEALGLSAVVSGLGYETTAETATPCQLNFIDRKNFLELMQSHSELGLHTAQSLSRDFQAAYRDIHDLVLTRSSAGKLARLLLSQSSGDLEAIGGRIQTMTHEEMAQRIGASRETVTRLLGSLKKKQLIRSDGPTLVIRDRMALAAMAV
jgi:CRP/FNR family transcriptional regulator, cyclic AMP receptor protein